MNGIIISRFRHEPYIITNAFIEMMDNESLMKTHSSNILLSILDISIHKNPIYYILTIEVSIFHSHSKLICLSLQTCPGYEILIALVN